MSVIATVFLFVAAVCWVLIFNLQNVRLLLTGAAFYWEEYRVHTVLSVSAIFYLSKEK